MTKKSSFIKEVKKFLKKTNCPFEALDSRDRTAILRLSETTSIHLIPLIEENYTLYTSHLYSQKLTDFYSQYDVQIIHIWEDQWINKQEIVKSRLLSMLGQSTRIHARETSVREITPEEAAIFLNKHHLNANTKSNHRYGLEKDNELVAVLTLGRKVRFNNRKFSWSIIRYCTANGKTVIGGLSKLISAFKKEYKPGHLMTYIDRDWSRGNGFETLGFTRQEMIPPTHYWLNLSENKRISPKKINEDVLSTSKSHIKIYNSGCIKMTWEDD